VKCVWVRKGGKRPRIQITKRHLPITNPQEKESVPKRVRTEVPEVSPFFSEPWGSLMKVMHGVMCYGLSNMLIPSGDNLPVACKALYTYICVQLEDEKVVLQHEKDLLVVMLGVINLRLLTPRTDSACV
jgi:hypothetical protein